MLPCGPVTRGSLAVDFPGKQADLLSAVAHLSIFRAVLGFESSCHGTVSPDRDLHVVGWIKAVCLSPSFGFR
jgi:hypothetical protein